MGRFQSHPARRCPGVDAGLSGFVAGGGLGLGAMEFARRLARGPQTAIQLIKRAVYEGLNIDLRTSLDLISSHMAVVTATPDHHEAVKAFLEKRQPHFESD